MKKIKLMIVFSMLFGFYASAQITYYVSSQSGNDTNSGLDQNVAFRSIQKAVNSVSEGDTVKILSGTYTGENDSPWSEIFMSISGSEEKYITFSGVPDEQGKFPVIVSASVKGIDLLGSSFVIIENLEFVPANQDVKGMIDNPSFGIELWRARRAIGIDNGSHHIIIRNNYVHDFPGNGIAIGGSEVVLIEGNLVEHCAFQSRNGNSGISSYQPANLNVSSFSEYPNHRIIYKDNVSRYNVNLRGFLGGGNRITDGNGIIVDDHIQDQKENGVPYSSKTLLIGNVCYGNGGQGINVFSSDNVDVYNNTLFDNAQSTRISNPAYPIAVGDSQLSIGRVKNARVKNNILYNSNVSKTTISRYQDENISYDQNIHWNATGNPEPLSSNDFIADPKLKSIQALNESQTNLLATTSNPFNTDGASAKLFTPTRNNSFPIQDMDLQSNSPAIDTGINVGFGAVIGLSIDIGAKEFDGMITTLEDKVISTLVPNQVVLGQETNITVSYEAKENRDISIVFQLDSSPYTVYKTNRIRVSRGSETVEVPVSIPEDTPIGVDKYQFQVYITAVGGNWNNRFSNLNKPNIDCVSEDIGVTQVLEVGAKGNCSGEKIEILLDNESVTQFTLTNDIDVYRYTNYKEGQNIKIAFVNDDNSACDLNAYIDWIKICNTLYQTEDYSSRTGCGSSEWLFCNGNFDFGNVSCDQNRSRETTMESIVVYPNPVSNSFFVENIKNESLSIKVINLEGKVLKSFQSETNDITAGIAIDDLPKGMYLLSIFSKRNKEQKTIKIYKE
ncbi:T9SS type A sorting domain-containing protein [uncultured Aquimarina sp.]|uniref:T9SS type A sorting domain-containing protein n=1 Tax=uncultured Aquimarina sp. TaxID=575652 RepID=UPI00261862ED|nr:T9SS type A sorting domain-containing protein [uncultured Aquimarina sp.]